jgi:hypothetical protein
MNADKEAEDVFNKTEATVETIIKVSSIVFDDDEEIINQEEV